MLSFQRLIMAEKNCFIKTHYPNITNASYVLQETPFSKLSCLELFQALLAVNLIMAIQMQDILKPLKYDEIKVIWTLINIRHDSLFFLNVLKLKCYNNHEQQQDYCIQSFNKNVSGDLHPQPPPPKYCHSRSNIPLFCKCCINATVFGKGLIHHNLFGQT